MAEGWLLAQWFEHFVDATPEHLALTGDGDLHLSYAELETAANRIAHAIAAADPEGAFPIVGLAIEHSADAIVAMMGASKSGRVIVPVDVTSPPARVASVLALVDPAVVLTRAADAHALADVPAGRQHVVAIDDLDPSLPTQRRQWPADPDGTEVIQFTSGSTGVPKGTPRPNPAAADALARRQSDQYLGPNARAALTSNFQWAAGWARVRDALSTGASLHVYRTGRRGPAELGAWLREERITTWWTVPPLAEAMLDTTPDLDLPDIRSVVFSGDVLHRSVVERLRRCLSDEAVISHRYGASETGAVAVFRVAHDTVLDSEIVPVGLPLTGVEVAILDPDSSGIGTIEVVSDRGITGYLGDAAGVAISAAGPGRTRYRMNDLGRLRPDGALELHGRTDRTTKVRGHRVDIGEVEAAVRAVPQVSSAVVGIRGGRIVAWVVPVPGGDVTVPTLRLALRKRLPGYMIPVAFVTLPELPLTLRSKVDHAALPDPVSGRPDLGHTYEPPLGAVEERVAAAFGRILEVEPVGRHDAFFDLGGDSLQAAEVMTLISAELGRDLPLSVFIDADTPARLAERLEDQDAAADRLVTLQPLGDKAPIVCIHGGGGQILSFAGFATRLGEPRPFLAIQMRTGDRARDLFRVRRLAARYAAGIERHLGDGPCVMAGHSYGGVVAFEVARQRRARGLPVEACVILDTAIPAQRPPVGRASPSEQVTGTMPQESLWKDLAYAAHALTGLAPKPHRLTTERMHAAIWGMNLYRPAVIDVPIIVVRALGSSAGRDLEGWARFTSAGCTVLDVPGDHHSILAAPHRHQVADDLQIALGDKDPRRG